MSLGDFIPCFVVILAASAAAYFGWWWMALFSSLFFLLLVANIFLHFLVQPLPRYIIGGVELPEDLQEKIRESLQEDDSE